MKPMVVMLLFLSSLAMFAQDEKILSPKEQTAALEADFRGQQELYLGVPLLGQPWSPFVAWTSASPDTKSLAGSISIVTLRHKVPKPAKKAYDRGAKALEHGDVVKAAKEFENAIALDPGFAAAHGELGVTYFRLNRVAEAEARLRHATALDPHTSGAQSNLAWVLFQTRNFDEAEQRARRALSLSFKNDRARALLGILLASSPVTRAEGIRHLEQARRTLPGLGRVLADLR